MIFPETIITEHPNLFKIDARLNKLVKKIELLNYVNPINIEQEKRTFFANRYNESPNFKYRRFNTMLQKTSTRKVLFQISPFPSAYPIRVHDQPSICI